MSQSNQEIIDRFFEAYARHDLDGLRLVLAEDAKWISLGRHPYSGVRNGIDQVIGFFDTMGALMSRSNNQVEKLIVCENDTYLLECQRVWTNREDGHNLDHLVCVLWKFGNGKIVEGRHFFSDPKAMDEFFTYLSTLQ